MSSDDLFILLGSIVLILMGINLLKSGIQSIKNDEKMIGSYSGKVNTLYGAMLIIGGIVVFIKIIFRQFN